MHRQRADHALCAMPLALVMGLAATARPEDLRLELRDGWSIQSSARVEAGGESLSRHGASTDGWHAARVPTTVVAALVADGTYPDPYVGMNLRRIPGVSYPAGENFSNLEMPADSPFAAPWWYRTEFTLPAAIEKRTLWLRFGGVNFRFDAWLNGTKIADSTQTAGAYRVHELDVSEVARPGPNALAVLVHAPRPNDLAITFVDWNPLPPDKVMGLYRPVTLVATGPVALRHPQVVTRLTSLERAELTVKVFARNATRVPRSGLLRARVGEASLEQPVALAAGETREIVLRPAAFPQLVVRKPRLWWPAQYGEPALHPLQLELLVDGQLSDRAETRFGIREFSSELTPSGRLFKVNGTPILIRGAGWTSELMLRYTRERDEAEIRYVKEIGLNTIRLEGKLEDEHFFDATDREGILVMPGWCCCDHWEKWERWQERDLEIATASLRDQILRLRGRASVFSWLNASDGPPPAKVERAYLEVLRELGFPNPVLSSATEKAAEHSGPSGVKMRGPYEWVPPIYWYTDTRHGGPHGFATEIGPGPSPPPLESLRRFIPEDRLWPIDDEVWSYHCGGGPFRTLGVFNAALDARYGPSAGIAEYARKAQVAAYESHRAMLESFGARKYHATGVVQWMLNNAWPSLIWHLYDFYLRPGGSYFGAKKACEPLHVQYSYDDRSVQVVNSTLAAHQGLVVRARVLDLEANERHVREATLGVGADGVAKAFELPAVPDLAGAHFLFLTLADAQGRIASRNVYWLSTRQETLDWDKSEWYRTPVKQYADLSGLARLPAVSLQAAASLEEAGGEGRARVRLENPSAAVAFFVHAGVRRGPDGDELLPAFWDDNYVTLQPGESRELLVRFSAQDLRGATPVVRIEGWNVAPMAVAAGR